MVPSFGNNLSLTMINMGFKRVGPWWNYKNVISPFYRLYYIESGHARVFINDEMFELTPGTLFLIPKFAFHSYSCEKQMDHYYFGIFDDLDNRPGIPDPYQMTRSVKASPLDITLVKRYLELNPNSELHVTDPQKYGNTRAIYQQRISQQEPFAARTVESSGILLQLFSRFINERCMQSNIQVNGYKNMQPVVEYIYKNMDKHISVSDLAGFMCLSTDHFSKVFKRIMGMTPSEFVISKRIERAEALLLTSNMNISQVAESIGISSSAQFSRLFTKATGSTPRQFRTKQKLLLEQ